MKLYLVFVRHGESHANIQHVISNRDSRFGLTELGRQQAKTLAASLRDIPLTTIYSSPVWRARETAEILSQSFGLPYQVTEALREYDCGILEGKSDAESWKLHGEIAEDWMVNQNDSRKPEGGECFLDIRDRFLPFVESLKQDRAEHILLIGHGGLFLLMLPLVLSNIDYDFARAHGIGHTECILAEKDSDHLVCLQWGNMSL